MQKTWILLLIPLLLFLSPAFAFTEENVIITPPEFYDYAQDLADFHTSDGINTTVVNTTWVYENYANASDPPFTGYSNSSLGGIGNITNYNYTLALRIVSFLNNTTAHPNLEYVTLFGNGLQVPPSYYAYSSASATYDKWVPTDFFYSSPDYNFDTSYMVGRLPVNNTTQANHTVQKIIAWNSTVSWDWFKNVGLAAGTPNYRTYHEGEMIVQEVVNRNALSGMNITRFFKTDGNFTGTHIGNALVNESYGMFYLFSHSNGQYFQTSSPYLTLADVMAFSNNSRVPVIVSLSCDAGAFDTNLYVPSYNNISIGEAFLLSEAGGIAYIGGSRTTSGTPTYHFDNGVLNITAHSYMEAIITYIFDAYHAGNNTLGAMAKGGLDYFIANHNPEMNLDERTIFLFALLGDPALRLPAQQQNTSYSLNVAALGSDSNISMSDSSNIPVYWNESANVSVLATSNASQLGFKRINATQSLSLYNNSSATAGGVAYYNFTTESFGIYSVRVTAPDEKQAWLFLTASAEPIALTNSSTHSCTSFNSIYDVVNFSVSNSSPKQNGTIEATIYWYGYHDQSVIPCHWAFFLNNTTLVMAGNTSASETLKPHFYVMTANLTIPQNATPGLQELRVTGNGYQGYCEPGENFYSDYTEAAVMINVSAYYGTASVNITHPAENAQYNISDNFTVNATINATGGNVTGCNATLSISGSAMNISAGENLTHVLGNIVEDNITATYWNITALSAGAVNATVSTSCSAGIAHSATIYNLTVLPAPSVQMPQNFTAALHSDNESIVLNWSSVPDAQGYRIYNSENATLLLNNPTNASYNSTSDANWTDGDAIMYSARYYRVAAYNGSSLNFTTNVMGKFNLPMTPTSLGTSTEMMLFSLPLNPVNSSISSTFFEDPGNSAVIAYYNTSTSPPGYQAAFYKNGSWQGNFTTLVAGRAYVMANNLPLNGRLVGEVLNGSNNVTISATNSTLGQIEVNTVGWVSAIQDCNLNSTLNATGMSNGDTIARYVVLGTGYQSITRSSGLWSGDFVCLEPGWGYFFTAEQNYNWTYNST
ncbi:MAG: C25 family cysteine peptidase [archaeon]